jgi:hypothetical protein
MRSYVEHFVPGDQLKDQVEAFARPRGLPRHVALRVLLADALKRVEQGHTPCLLDPLHNGRRGQSPDACAAT